MKIIDTYFKESLEKHGFRRKRKLFGNSQILRVYESSEMGISLKKYGDSIYVYLFSVTDPLKEFDLYHVLDFLNIKTIAAQAPENVLGSKRSSLWYEILLENHLKNLFSNLPQIIKFFQIETVYDNLMKLDNFIKMKNESVE